MKLLRYLDYGTPHLGVLRGEEIVSLDALAGDYPTVQAIAAGGAQALQRVREAEEAAPITLPLASAHLLAPIERPGKYLAIGMNYRKHVEESERIGVPAPKQQLWFNKQTTHRPWRDREAGL